MLKIKISKKFSGRVKKGFVACMVGLLITSAGAFAVQGGQIAKDGTYTGEGDGTMPKHHTKATIVVEKGIIKDLINVEGKHAKKYERDTEKFKASILGQKATYENIDAVSKATTKKYVFSLKNAVLDALKKAPEATPAPPVKPNDPKKPENAGKVEKKEKPTNDEMKKQKKENKDAVKNKKAAKSPETSDESNLLIAGGILLLSGAGVIATSRRKKEK